MSLPGAAEIAEFMEGAQPGASAELRPPHVAEGIVGAPCFLGDALEDYPRSEYLFGGRSAHDQRTRDLLAEFRATQRFVYDDGIFAEGMGVAYIDSASPQVVKFVVDSFNEAPRAERLVRFGSSAYELKHDKFDAISQCMEDELLYAGTGASVYVRRVDMVYRVERNVVYARTIKDGMDWVGFASAAFHAKKYQSNRIIPAGIRVGKGYEEERPLGMTPILRRVVSAALIRPISIDELEWLERQAATEEDQSLPDGIKLA